MRGLICGVSCHLQAGERFASEQKEFYKARASQSDLTVIAG